MLWLVRMNEKDPKNNNLASPETQYKLEAFLDINRSQVVQQTRRIKGYLADLSKELPDDIKKTTALGDLDKVRTGHYADDEQVRTAFGLFVKDLYIYMHTDIPVHRRSEGYDRHAMRFKELKKSFAKVIKGATFGASTNPHPQNLNKTQS